MKLAKKLMISFLSTDERAEYKLFKRKFRKYTFVEIIMAL